MLLKYAGLWAEDVSCVEGHLAMLNRMPTFLASKAAESCYKPCKKGSVLEASSCVSGSDLYHVFL